MSNQRYTLYGFDISYFTGKMHAYLRYKGIPHEFIEPRWWDMVNLVYPQTGLMKVPAVRTPEGAWLQDTSPMIDWFETRFPNHPVLPSDPGLAFLCQLVEDYADEWLWRPALHFRWSYPIDSSLYTARFCEEFLADVPIPKGVKRFMARHRQMKHYVRGDGVNRQTLNHVEEIYLRNLEWLEQIFQHRPFLLGSRPCVADFGYFASMFRHFSLDPTPARIMRDQAPSVYEWVARMWNARAGKLNGVLPVEHTPPADWAPILSDIGSAYLPYLHANALAWKNGQKRFDVEIQGVEYSNLPVVQYRVWCREQLQEKYAALDSYRQSEVREVLEHAGCLKPLLESGTIRSDLLAGNAASHPAERQPRKTSIPDRVLLYFTGTHWKVPHGSLSQTTV